MAASALARAPRARLHRRFVCVSIEAGSTRKREVLVNNANELCGSLAISGVDVVPERAGKRVVHTPTKDEDGVAAACGEVAFEHGLVAQGHHAALDMQRTTIVAGLVAF